MASLFNATSIGEMGTPTGGEIRCVRERYTHAARRGLKGQSRDDSAAGGLEMRTVAGPASVVQCVLSGGPYTVSSQARHVHVYASAFNVSAAVTVAGLMTY
jgi:hypothetical protein